MCAHRNGCECNLHLHIHSAARNPQTQNMAASYKSTIQQTSASRNTIPDRLHTVCLFKFSRTLNTPSVLSLCARRTMGCVRSRARDEDSTEDDGRPPQAAAAYPTQATYAPQTAQTAFPPPYAAQLPPYVPGYPPQPPQQPLQGAYAWYPPTQHVTTTILPPQQTVYYAPPPPMMVPPPIMPLGVGVGFGVGMGMGMGMGFAGAGMMYGSCDSLSLNSFGSFG